MQIERKKFTLPCSKLLFVLKNPSFFRHHHLSAYSLLRVLIKGIWMCLIFKWFKQNISMFWWLWIFQHMQLVNFWTTCEGWNIQNPHECCGCQGSAKPYLEFQIFAAVAIRNFERTIFNYFLYCKFWWTQWQSKKLPNQILWKRCVEK